jgi:hypothetical protein
MTVSGTIVRLDRMHSGIRFFVMLSLIAGIILGWIIILPSLLDGFGLSGPTTALFSIVGGIGFGLALGWGTEQLLLQIWPSGRSLEMAERSIILHEKSGDTVTLALDQRINVIQWYFVIKGGKAWIPKGWYCVALQLTQNETMISPYAFMKPAQAQELANWDKFEELLSRKTAPKQGQEVLLQRYSEQGRLRTAERDRWNIGAEMSPQDMQALIQHLTEYAHLQWGQE